MDTLERLLAPIPGESPCGEDITWDPLLAEIRTAVRPTLDRKMEENGGGKRMVETFTEPNWHGILKLCETAFQRSKHLEVCVIYATASLQLRGLEGATEGLTLISRLVQEYWDFLYPLLDAEDGFDPSTRFGLIENLSQEGAIPEHDPLRFVERLRRAPICQLPRVGVINLLSLQQAKPRSSAPEAEFVRSAIADAVVTSPDQIRSGFAATATALNSLEEMNRYLTEVRGLKRLPALGRLEQQLALIREVYQMSETSGNGQPQAAISSPETPGAQDTTMESGRPVVAAAAADPGEIRSSADVIRSLDKICEYYKRAEPSSPVPLILMRARRLVDQSFMDVLNDLASSAVDQVKVITGQQ